MFSFKEMHLNISSGKWWPFCLGRDVLIIMIPENNYFAVLLSFHNWPCGLPPPWTLPAWINRPPTMSFIMVAFLVLSHQGQERSTRRLSISLMREWSVVLTWDMWRWVYLMIHDDITIRKRFPHYWPFVRWSNVFRWFPITMGSNAEF